MLGTLDPCGAGLLLLRFQQAIQPPVTRPTPCPQAPPLTRRPTPPWALASPRAQVGRPLLALCPLVYPQAAAPCLVPPLTSLPSLVLPPSTTPAPTFSLLALSPAPAPAPARPGTRISTGSQTMAASQEGRTAGSVRTSGALTATRGGGLTSATQVLLSGASGSAVGTTFGQGLGASSLQASTQGRVSGPFGPASFRASTTVNSALGVAGSAAGEAGAGAGRGRAGRLAGMLVQFAHTFCAVQGLPRSAASPSAQPTAPQLPLPCPQVTA